VVDVDDVAVAGDLGEIRCALKLRITLSSPRWSRPRCPELVAGSGKHVEVVMWSNDVQEVSTIGHVVVVGSPYHSVKVSVRVSVYMSFRAVARS